MNTPIFDQMMAERAARRPGTPPAPPRYAREVLTARPEPAAVPEAAEAAAAVPVAVEEPEKTTPALDVPESPVERPAGEPATAVTLLDMVSVREIRDALMGDTAPMLVP